MNSEFRHWLELSGLANKELARRIRTRAQNKGLKQVSTEASRIRGWLAGQQPAPDVAEIVAEVLTEACREPLTPTALGFTGGQSKGKHAPIDLTGHISHVAQQLQAHSRSDLLVPEPTNDSTEIPVTGNQLVRPVQRWITAEPHHSNGVGLGRSRISVDECADLEAVTRMFREWDNRAGGGLRRKAVVAQLSEVSELLKGTFDSPQTRRRLFDAVADLAQLVGWMSYDVGLHATAQRYFVLGLHLAKEAGDRLQGARMLYCMARQLIEVRQPGDALELLDLALYGSRRTPAPKVRTLLLGMRARAIANQGRPDADECERSIDLARESFAGSSKMPDPEWAAFYDEAELAGVIGACYRDLAMNDGASAQDHAGKAEASTQDAINLRDDGYQRSRVLDLANLATTYVLMGEPEQAAKTATNALTIAGRVRSTRMANRFRSTTSLAIERYPKVTELHELQERVSLSCGPTETMDVAS